MKNEIQVSNDEIVELTNLTRTRLLQLADEGRIARPVRGQWKLIETMRGLVTYYQDRLKNRSNTPELIAAKERKAQHDEKLAAIKLAEKEGKILERASVESIWAKHIIGARNILARSSLTPAELKRVVSELEIAAGEYTAG